MTFISLKSVHKYKNYKHFNVITTHFLYKIFLNYLV